MQPFLKELLESHGYWVLFAGTLLEGETILVMAGFLAFQGYLNIYAVVAIASLGSFFGDQIFFYIGRNQGRSLFSRYHFIAKKFREAIKLIEKYGNFVAFISRFTYGFRIALPIILGVTRFKPQTFLYINILSAILWSIIFSVGGYMFGKSASLFLNDISKYEHYLLFALAIFMAFLWSLHIYHLWRLKKPARDRLERIRKLKLEKISEQ